LCRPALDSYVADIIAGRVQANDRGDPARRVGLFTVHRTEILEDGSVRLMTAGSLMDDFGFVYSANAEPPDGGGDNYWHITGPWWRWWGDY
jgi:hypothetical protein